MCHHRCRIALLSVLFILLAFAALPAAAQPGRTAEAAAPGLRWSELWQSFMAPFAVLTGDGRAIWDPNGDPTPAPPPSGGDTVEGMADGEEGVPL